MLRNMEQRHSTLSDQKLFSYKKGEYSMQLVLPDLRVDRTTIEDVYEVSDLLYLCDLAVSKRLCRKYLKPASRAVLDA